MTASGVRRVVFSGLNNENLAGKVITIFDENGKPVIKKILDGDKELELYIPGAIIPGRFYYISAIPDVLAKGFKMVFYTGYKHATLTVPSAVEVKRSAFGTLKDADAGLTYEEGGFLPEGTADLGLSVLWASCNIGADSPEQSGRYFGWGDIEGQTWNDGWSGSGFNDCYTYELDTAGNLKPEYDAAHVNLGGAWRMPTRNEHKELIDNCTSTWTDNYNGTGIAGRIFTSNKEGFTDRSIFLPAAGFGSQHILREALYRGTYWSSTFISWQTSSGLRFYSSFVNQGGFERESGFPIRPVLE